MADKKKVRIMRGLRIDELSFVDRPANKGARVSIFKRAGDEGDAVDVAKDVHGILSALAVVAIAKDDSDNGAKSFAQLLTAAQEQERRWKAYAELCPYFDALIDTVRSISADANKSVSEKAALVQSAAADFADAVTAAMPDVEQELQKLLDADPASAAVFHQAMKAKEQHAMAQKTPAELEAALKEANDKLSVSETALKAATDANAELTKRAEAAETALKSAQEEVTKAAGDETATIEGVEVKKSAVGEATFTILKKQQDRIDLAGFEKAAESPDFNSLPGETVAKARGLRAIAKMGKEDREAVETMLKAGNKALADAMKASGKDGGGDDGDAEEVTKAQKEMADLVKAQQDKNPALSAAQAHDLVYQTKRGQELLEILEDVEVADDED